MPGIEVGSVGGGFNPQSFVNSDPYNFLAQQGMEGVKRLNAAKGTYLTGGTLKDAMKFNQGLASTYWGQQQDQDYRYDALNADIAEGNAGRTLSGLSTLAGYGMGAANGMAGAYGNVGQAQGYGTRGAASAINQGVTGAASSLADYFARRRAANQPAGATPYTPSTGIKNDWGGFVRNDVNGVAANFPGQY